MRSTLANAGFFHALPAKIILLVSIKWSALYETYYIYRCSLLEPRRYSTAARPDRLLCSSESMTALL